MHAEPLLSSSLLLAWSAYFVMCASPGPSVLAIMGMAMGAGRRPALAFAMGALCGSMFWGQLAALGLGAVLTRYAPLLLGLKIAGGLYLLWLALKSARAAATPHADVAAQVQAADVPLRHLYLRGLVFHLTNPKAIMTWLSVVSLALPQGGTLSHALLAVGGCNLIAFFVFGGYAILFSTGTARRVYLALRRWLEATLALAFGVAGIKMLVLRS